MALGAKIFTARVMHKRTLPKVNQFIYRVAYLAVPLSQWGKWPGVAANRFSFLSFWNQDYGAKDGTPPEQWVRGILATYQLESHVADIVLVTVPRVLGYGFNPVNFWLCLDEMQALRAVIAEVNNTFGETHSYIIAHPDGREIHPHDWLEAKKLFHVSPFFERDGFYQFRTAYTENSLGIWIDYYSEEKHKRLFTSLTGKLTPLTRKAIWVRQITHPLMTFRTIFLIHWQALKLISKGIRYISKPVQHAERQSATRNLTKM